MGRSSLRYATCAGLAQSDFLGDELADDKGTLENTDSVNVCLLPDFDSVKIAQSSSLSFNHFGRLLRQKALSSVPRPLTTTPKLSEKAWFLHAKKSWDIIKSSDMFHDYYKVITSDFQ